MSASHDWQTGSGPLSPDELRGLGEDRFYSADLTPEQYDRVKATADHLEDLEKRMKLAKSIADKCVDGWPQWKQVFGKTTG